MPKTGRFRFFGAPDVWEDRSSSPRGPSCSVPPAGGGRELPYLGPAAGAPEAAGAPDELAPEARESPFSTTSSSWRARRKGRVDGEKVKKGGHGEGDFRKFSGGFRRVSEVPGGPRGSSEAPGGSPEAPRGPQRGGEERGPKGAPLGPPLGALKGPL